MAWLNHVVIAAPRNATTTHTVSPSSGTVVSGSLFTPTAGRLLVCVIGAAVTSTTPTGWTLPTNGSAVNNAGIYVWWRVAAGSDTITTTHNSANFPAAVHFIEWASTYSFVGAASAANSTNGAAVPTLSGLTGTNEVGYMLTQANANTGASFSVTWGAGPTEIVDTSTDKVTTDGYVYSMAFNETVATATTNAAATSTLTGSFTAPERLAFAVKTSGGVTPPALPIIVLAPRR